MGYTHHWTQNRPFSNAEWSQLRAATREIIAASGVQIVAESDTLEGPSITLDEIYFNGYGEDGHETFGLDREGTGRYFCKTERKPYDVVVVAVLDAADTIAPGALTVAHDGGDENLAAGRALYLSTLTFEPRLGSIHTFESARDAIVAVIAYEASIEHDAAYNITPVKTGWVVIVTTPHVGLEGFLAPTVSA